MSGVCGELKVPKVQDCDLGGGKSAWNWSWGPRDQQEHRWGLGFVFLEICFPSSAWNPLTLSTIATLPGVCRNMSSVFS